MEDGNPDFIEGRINFAKRELTAKVIRELIDFQQTQYTIQPIEELAVYFSNLPKINDDQDKLSYNLSKSLE
jgi:hypothetical protein